MAEPAVLPTRRPGLVRGLARSAERAFALLGAGIVAFHACFDLSYLVSDSMAPTLRGPAAAQPDRPNVDLYVPGEVGDRVLSEKLSYRFRAPRRWEVIATRNDLGQRVMKRVIGLPGERVALDATRVRIDGAPVEPPASLAALRYYAYGLLAGGREVDDGEGYFLMGDNAADSQDSRFDGPFSRAQVEARAWWVVWPPSRIGPIQP